MKSVITILTFAVLAAAADSYSNASYSNASSASTATPSSSIPNASPECSSFLNALNSAPGIQSCVDPLLTTLTSNNTSLPSLCSAATSSSCSDTTIRAWLADFQGNCSSEITSGDKNVLALYDVLYAVKPFVNAVCSKDASGAYCITQLANNSTAKSASGMQNVAQTPLTNSDGTPNSEAFANANILWLGANPKMDAAALCTLCTKEVLTSYMRWESQMPPAAGIANSPLLSSQAGLWSAVQKSCPADFITGTLSNAGASPEAAISAASSYPAKGVALILSLVAVAVTLL